MSDNYSMRELDLKFQEIHHRFDDLSEKLGKVIIQTTKTNGRVTKHDKIMLVFGTVVAVLLITNGSRLVDFVSNIFI